MRYPLSSLSLCSFVPKCTIRRLTGFMSCPSSRLHFHFLLRAYYFVCKVLLSHSHSSARRESRQHSVSSYFTVTDPPRTKLKFPIKVARKTRRCRLLLFEESTDANIAGPDFTNLSRNRHEHYHDPETSHTQS